MDNKREEAPDKKGWRKGEGSRGGTSIQNSKNSIHSINTIFYRHIKSFSCSGESISDDDSIEDLDGEVGEVGELGEAAGEDSQQQNACNHKECNTTSKEEKDQLSLAPTDSSSTTSFSSPMVTKSSSLRSSSSQAGIRLYNQGLEKMKRLERQRREQEESVMNSSNKKPSMSSIRAGLRLHNLAAQKQKKLDAVRKKIQDEETLMSKTVSTRGNKKRIQNTATKPRYIQLYELGKEKNQDNRMNHLQTNFAKPRYMQLYEREKEREKHCHLKKLRFRVTIIEPSNGGCNREASSGKSRSPICTSDMEAVDGLKHNPWETSCHSFSFFKCI